MPPTHGAVTTLTPCFRDRRILLQLAAFATGNALPTIYRATMIIRQTERTMPHRQFAAVALPRWLPVACVIIGAVAADRPALADTSTSRRPNVLLLVSEDNGPQFFQTE